MTDKKQSIFSILQRIGHSFLFPAAILPIAGLLLGIGASFTNPQMISSYGIEWLVGGGTFLNFILTVIKNTGEIVFANLPIIFAMSVALGMAKQEKGVATISSAIAFLIMHKTISTLLLISGKLNSANILEGTLGMVCGIQTLEMGVFAGMLIGLIVAWLHNRFYKIKLPDWIAFFGGVRFVPIISAFFSIAAGTLMFFIWPYIQQGVYSLGYFVTQSKYAGTFVYGIIERALIPFGLHHVFYMPFWQTGLGGTAVIDGNYIVGAMNIFFAELASPNTVKFSVNATRFMAGKFPFMMFGLPAASFAMYRCAKNNKKKVVGSLLFSAALVAIITGVTEPIEFTFLFVAPALYAAHCVFAGLSFMLMHMLKVCVGMTFSGGIIELLLYGIIPGNSKTNWVAIIPVGICYATIYYFCFKFAIKKFNLMTPGREEDEIESKLYTKKDFEVTKENFSEIIIEGLGGKKNIEYLDSCATRLRVKVINGGIIDSNLIKQSGSLGIIQKENNIQIIYGPKVTVIKSELEEYLNQN
ncbi:MAG: PTS transporter subunit EIIC [Oscillospiraceae bacterium]|jgi:glucose-like phosphotransferase system IIB component|nr:PTS transporter subunit EIIC [Oscillospiraceae bacterium]